MIHINQMVSELKLQPNDIREACQILDLPIDNDELPAATVETLKNTAKAAQAANISIVDAALQILEMQRAAKKSESSGFKFDARSYIQQRFGKDPENEAKDSFVGILYRDMPLAYQLGDTRFMAIMEVSSLVLRDRLTNGLSSASNKNMNEFTAAQDRVLDAIDTDFFENINWGEDNPKLGGLSTPQQKQLKSLQPKTAQSPKK